MITELAKFRQKYPEYNDLDDLTLAKKLATNHPEYRDLPTKVASEFAGSGLPPQPAEPFTPAQPVRAKPPSEAESAMLAQAGLPSGMARVQQPGASEGPAIDPLSMLNWGLSSIPLTGLGEMLSTPKRAIEAARGAKAVELAQAAKQGEPAITSVLRQVAPQAAEKGAPSFAKPAANILSPKEFEAEFGGWPNYPFKVFGRSGELNKVAAENEIRFVKSVSSDAETIAKADKALDLMNKGIYSYDDYVEYMTKNVKGISVAKPTLPPPKPSFPELDKSALDILKGEEGFVTTEPIQKGAKSISDYYRSAQDWFGSPYHILNVRDPSGTGLKLWRLTDEADRAKKQFISGLRAERMASVKVAPGTDSSVRVGELLDNYQTWEEVPAYLQTQIAPEERQAFQWYRSKWDQLHQGLVDKGLIAPERKIKSYLFRVFDKETIRKAWGDELELLRGTAAKQGFDFKQTVKVKEQIAKLEKSIDTYDRTGQVLYDYLPKELTAPFLRERTGGKGYALDAVKAFDSYEYWYARKLFDEPAVKAGTELWKDLPPDLKPYAKWYLRQFAGMERPPKINNLMRTLTSLEYMKDLGFNIRSALVNSTQNLNTIVDIGPKFTAEGAYRALFDPEAQAIWKASGHATDVPELRYGLRSKHLGKAMDAAGYLFDKAETANRKVAYLGGYYKALSEGKSPELAKMFGDDVVTRNQFQYGRTGAPMGMTKLPGGPALFQFSTFSIKQLERFSIWARENPVKLLSYIAIASGAGEGLKELGVDMTNALGIGVDWRQLFQAGLHLGRGELTATRIHTELGLPKIPGLTMGVAGSGIFPSGIAPLIETTRNVLKEEWDKLLPAQVSRTYQSAAALREGQIQTWGGAQGYPIRNIRTGELSHVETAPQLASKALLAKPTVETNAFQASAEKQLSEHIRQEIKKKALDRYMRGNEEAANEMVQKYGITFTKDDFTNAMMKRNLTSQERLNLEKLKSRQGTMFRQSLGEQVTPNMP